MTVQSLLAHFALLLRMIRPARGLHAGPWRDGPESAARVRPYVRQAERAQHTARLRTVEHAVRLQRAALSEARAERRVLEVAR